MTDALPHEAYIAAVADELETYGMAPDRWGATSSDGLLLEGYLGQWPEGQVDADTWPHGVSLIWSQHEGWQLVEDDGGRNLRDLDDEEVGVYAHPRQVACSAANAVRGQGTTGRICTTTPWDSRPLEAAVAAWEAEDDTAA